MHHPTDRIAHTTAFVTPVVEHWLEREIAQWVHPMKDRSDDPSHHERTRLPRSYVPLLHCIDVSVSIFICLSIHQSISISLFLSFSICLSVPLFSKYLSVQTFAVQPCLKCNLFEIGHRCGSVVRVFAHGATGRQIDHSWWTH